MFDGLREDWQEQPRPAFVRSGSVSLPLILGALVFAALMLFMAMARAQIPPQGQPVTNQALQARLLTKSDTATFITTRGIFIGDPVACNIAVIFAGDSAAVTLSNVQPGSSYPFSIYKLMSTNTSCGTVIALY